jgi:hypothetical protein
MGFIGAIGFIGFIGSMSGFSCCFVKTTREIGQGGPNCMLPCYCMPDIEFLQVNLLKRMMAPPSDVLSRVRAPLAGAIKSFTADQIGARLRTLRDLHRRYDHAADTESSRRFPDGLRLKRLKVSRLAVKGLAVKDEIAHLERRLVPCP